MLEDYSALETSVANLTDKHPLLTTIGSMFASVGMCAQAVTAYIKVKVHLIDMANTVTSYTKIPLNLILFCSWELLRLLLIPVCISISGIKQLNLQGCTSFRK